MKLLTVKNILELTHRVGLPNIFRGVRDEIYNDFSNWDDFDKIPRVANHCNKGVIELMPISNKDMYSMKYVNGHPQNYLFKNLPTVMAFGVLAKMDTGEPILLSEMTFSTAIRTAATSVLAAQLVARKNSKTMAIIGNGAQSEFQVLAFHYLMGINHFKLYDIDKNATTKLRQNLSFYENTISTVVCERVDDACKDVDIITTITADKAYRTIVDDTMVTSGQHINAVGGDCPGKTELSKKLLLKSKIFTEYTPQTRIEGDIQQMSPDFPVTELQEIIRTPEKYKREENSITVFDSVGFALEDYSTLNYFYKLSNRYKIGVTDTDLIARTENPKDLFSLIL
jgi:ornithine cyclodeaminase